MDLEKVLHSIKLPTLSKTLYDIIELEKRNPVSFVKDLTEVVGKDPFLSAQILKVANSPFYGFPQEIRTLSHAIVLLGTRKIRDLAFTFSIFDFLKKVDYQPKFGNTFNCILKKSLIFSSISLLLAQKVSYPDPDELYVSGLLADIGQLVLFLHTPAKYHKIYSPRDEKLIKEERKAFATDHIELGMTFCEYWNFPGYFKEGIKNHVELTSDEVPNKISFIANQLTELLLSDDDSDRKDIFKEVENNTKKLLHLSLSEVDATIKALPNIMGTYINDFPEMQKDLAKIIATGSSLIITLMKEELDMVLLTQQLSGAQAQVAREKIFLSHMLNLSYFFSSLVSPEKIMASLFEYFEHFINEFTIEFIYKDPATDHFALMTGKEFSKKPISADDFQSLVKSRISNEPVRLETTEMKELEIDPDKYTLVFPISYHNNFFGFLLLKVASEDYLALDLEMSYVQILANIIANSFQNYFNYQGRENETNKKTLVTRELFTFDKELTQSKKNLLILQKNEVLGEMLPVIFHKLKNKLTPILGYSQILLTKVEDEFIRERILKIEKNANELTEQLNFLKDYFKGEEQIREKENLNNIIGSLKPYFIEIQSVENIKINLDLDPSVPYVMLIPGQIEVLATNIIDNAVQAIKEKAKQKTGHAGHVGMISIKTRITRPGNAHAYTLTVRDNGIGVDEAELQEIWTPFFSHFPGKAGLGLCICERVIANHEASRTIKSIKGEYLELTVTFPFKKTPAEEVITDYIPAPRKKSLRGKILIVDDEAYLVDLMKEILLNDVDLDIVTSTSGPEALQMLQGDDGFDLVITDIRMPEISGMDIYEFLRTKKMEKKVIMVTADPYSQDIYKFLKKTKVECLKKPFQLMDFKKKVLDKLS
ncbi:MAG: HDOD domain-containing protein [Candidatus Aminicenantes bacterium]|nr:HDOD domain-containing protein [Candidatus Aminicenantes bacterium]